MDQDQIISPDVSVKSPPNFDTIPEDIALSIVKFIQSWEINEVNQEQREKARKARDSTLRAAALTSPRTFKTYFTSLLQNVTLDVMHLFSFCQMLERGEPHYGALVRSIRFEESYDHFGEADLKRLTALGGSFSTLPTTASSFDRLWQGIQLGIGRCYLGSINLQSLVLSSPFVSFHHFHHKIGEQVKPHAFLDGTLKRLFIQLWKRKSSPVNPNLNARNATWLLVFCRQIEQASLAFEMSIEDSKYLSEFAETIAGVSSVKKLAIDVNFVYKEEEKKTWWGTSEEENGNHKGGNLKTESIINFLQSTIQLDALEIYVPFSDVRKGDPSQVSLDCLSTLSRSFSSLKHLRLIGALFSMEIAPSWLSLSFKALRVLTLDFRVMLAFSQVDLPESLEILCLPFYSLYASSTSEEGEGDYREEKLLENMIDHKCRPIFSCLKEVVVPSTPIGVDERKTVSSRGTQLWAEGRETLKRANVIRSGKVKLRTVEAGESVGDASKGEVFWSTVRWLSPP